MNREKLLEIVNKSTSLSDVLRHLGKSVSGSAIKVLEETLNSYGIQYHFLNKKDIVKAKSLEDILVDGCNYKSSTLLKRLIKEGLKKNECENPKCHCKNGYWLDNPISYQLHHINGKHDDNRLENLLILCPNCHSQTDNWGTKKLKNINYCKDCGKEISRGSTYCIKCAPKHRNQFKVDPKDRPDKEKLLSLIKKYPFTKIGEMYGVTDNTIRKWCKNYDIPHTKKELRELILENK